MSKKKNQTNIVQLTQVQQLTKSLQDSPLKKCNNQQSQQPSFPKKRFHQPLWIYILVILAQLFTTFAIMLLIFIQNSTITYGIYIGMTIVRCSIWFYSSYNLIGCCWPFVRLYFMLDNILLLQIASDASFIGLNYQNQKQLAIQSMCLYPFLLFFLAGNFRVMLVYCNWKPWQILIYKMVRFLAATFYMIYGIVYSIEQSIDNVQLYLLFIVSTFGFDMQLLNVFNAMDQSDNLILKLSFKDDQCQALYVERQVQPQDL